MKYILPALFLLFNFSLKAQKTYIPNNNFEQAIINLGLDNGFPDDSVITSHIDTLTYLDVSFSSINDLTGIEDFTNLKILKCQSNLLANIDVSKNLLLKELWCHYNQLTTINTDSNSLLELLICSYNSINQVDVTQNINLKILETINNPLGTIDVSQNILLEELFCENNQLNNLNISSNSNLKILWCKYNNISNIDVTQNPNLEYLICSGNNLGSIDLSQNPNLYSFICLNSQLSNIDVSNNTMLAELFCDSNQIDTLYLGNNPALEKLHCRRNYLLKSLDLSSNSALLTFACNDNFLSSLNIKNGNNTNLFTFSALYNPQLYCIEVDDSIYSTNNWTQIDTQCVFSENCSITLSLEEEYTENQILLYPNPTSNILNFNSSLKIDQIEIRDMAGSLTKKSIPNQHYISLEKLPSGIYIASISIGNSRIVRKVIKY